MDIGQIVGSMKAGVYILRCANKRYYAGSTNDIDRRITEHERGHVAATRYLPPIKLAFFEECETLKEARMLERELKNKKSRAIIEKIIKDGYIKFMRA